MDTVYFVSAKQLDKRYAIKDMFLLKQIIDEVEKYQKKLNALGTLINLLNVWELEEKLNEPETIAPDDLKPEDINVIAFGKSRIDELKELKRESSAANMATVVNGLFDYFRSDFVPITAITAKMLGKYETYMRKPRMLIRFNQFK